MLPLSLWQALLNSCPFSDHLLFVSLIFYNRVLELLLQRHGFLFTICKHNIVLLILSKLHFHFNDLSFCFQDLLVERLNDVNQFLVFRILFFNQVLILLHVLLYLSEFLNRLIILLHSFIQLNEINHIGHHHVVSFLLYIGNSNVLFFL